MPTHAALLKEKINNKENTLKSQIRLVPITGEYANKKPQLIVTKKSYHPREPIKIIWKNAPGYHYGYISISPVNNHGWAKAMDKTTRLYTQMQVNGVIEYSNKNVQGNVSA